MADDPKYQVPDEMRDFAEKSVQQARKAFDGFIGATNKAVDTAHGSASAVQASGADAVRKTVSYAEQNVAAAFDLAEKMVRSKDVQEVMQHQAEYLRSQLAALQTQMKDVGTTVQSQMRDASATMQQAAQDAIKPR